MKFKLFFVFSAVSLLLISCGTTKQESPEEVIVPGTTEPEEVIEEIQEEIVIEEPETEPEVLDDEEVEIIDEVVEVDSNENEYLRSIVDMETEDETVSIDEFNEDKAAILRIIGELEKIMSNFEFENWKDYIDPDSIEYYSNPANLRKAQKKLPDKMIQLKGLRDYFKHVFIPSRRQSQVEEIRYLSKTYIKAVEVREDEGTTVVYYYFVKKGDKWLVKLPEIS